MRRLPGDDRYDLGLAIKTSSREVCVPGFSQPTEDGNGWMYSAAVINILADYKKLHPWVWQGVVKGDSEGPGKLAPTCGRLLLVPRTCSIAARLCTPYASLSSLKHLL